jgi:hypothetical protein
MIRCYSDAIITAEFGATIGLQSVILIVGAKLVPLPGAGFLATAIDLVAVAAEFRALMQPCMDVYPTWKTFIKKAHNHCPGHEVDLPDDFFSVTAVITGSDGQQQEVRLDDD